MSPHSDSCVESKIQTELQVDQVYDMCGAESVKFI